ncbi:MAG: Metal-dependent hydrolase YbeY, involved in rRNA and/or ribosome maturation and assembly [Ktedonobacterales bacterium]|jgi:probable rRNA maturation factor|nr:MAG: Metal-dependent hydrolase YbeY, involved in rRNA and/or ribosome maturation and assembly [Ktedonobacterales bacterium]
MGQTGQHDDIVDTAFETLVRLVDEALVLAVSDDASAGPAEHIFGLDDEALRQVVARALALAGVTQPVEISVLMSGDEGLRALNRDYRGRDETTDVLSFPLLDAPLAQAPAEQLWQPPEFDAEFDGAREGAPEDALECATAADVTEYDLDADEREDDAGADDEDEALAFLTPEAEALHLGDIAISRDAVRRQAAQAGHSPTWEFAYLLAHGVLHLAGYDDHTDAGYQAMVAHQETALARAGIAR